MKLRSIVIFVFIVCCQSCINNTDNIKNIEIPVKEESIEFSKLRATATSIQLSTSDVSLVGEISNIRITEKYIYLSDNTKILRFDYKGRFCDCLYKLGEAPDEYLSITDFMIAGDSCVWISSHDDMKLKKYNWDNRSCESIQLSLFPNNVMSLNDVNFLIYAGYAPNEYHSRILKINKNDLTVSAYLPNVCNKSKYMFIQAKTIFNIANENHAYVNEIFNDTIYKIEANNIRPFFRLDFGSKNIPEDFYDEPISNIAEFFQRIWAKNYAYGTSFIIPTERNFYVSYYHNKKMHIAVINNETMSCIADFTKINSVNAISDSKKFDIDLTETESFVDAKSGTIIFVLDGDANEQVSDPNPKLVLMQLK